MWPNMEIDMMMGKMDAIRDIVRIAYGAEGAPGFLPRLGTCSASWRMRWSRKRRTSPTTSKPIPMI